MTTTFCVLRLMQKFQFRLHSFSLPTSGKDFLHVILENLLLKSPELLRDPL